MNLRPIRVHHQRTYLVLVCGWCCQPGHSAGRCRLSPEVEAHSKPLEVPSHNGPYLGTAKVRVVPPGVPGDELAAEHIVTARELSSKRGRVGSRKSYRARLEQARAKGQQAKRGV